MTGSEIFDLEMERRKDFYRFSVDKGQQTLKNAVKWEAKDLKGVPELRAGMTLMWSRPIDELYDGQTSQTVEDVGLVDIAKHVVWESIIIYMRAAVEKAYVDHLVHIRESIPLHDVKATYFPGQVVQLPNDEIWEFRPNARHQQTSRGFYPLYNMNLGWDQVYPEPKPPEITIQPKEKGKSDE